MTEDTVDPNATTTAAAAAKEVDGSIPTTTIITVDSFLQEAGMDQIPMDPASLEALTQILAHGSGGVHGNGRHCSSSSSSSSSNHTHDVHERNLSMATAATERRSDNVNHHQNNNDNDDRPLDPLLLDASQHRPSQQQQQPPPPPSLTSHNASSASPPPPPPTFEIPNEASATERLILEQLRHQSQALADLHHRLDDIATQQQQQQQQQRLPTATTTMPPAYLAAHRARGVGPNGRLADGPPPHQYNNNNNNTVNDPQWRMAPPPVPRQAAAAAAVPHPDHHHEMVLLSAFLRLQEGVRTAWTNLGESRLVRLAMLFDGLLRAQILPRLQPAVILKVVVMLTILLSRMSSPRSSSSNHTNSLRLVVTISLVVFGYAVQCGLVAWVYRFVVTHEYPQRIWAGQVIGVEDALREEREGRMARGGRGNHDNGEGNDDNNHAAHAAPWYQTLLGQAVVLPADPEEDGVAAAAEPPAPRNHHIVVQTIQDLIFFFGSLILSIFPMWQPGRIERAPPRAPAVDEDAAVNNNNNNVDNHHGPEALPVIRAPVDPVGAAEEEEDGADAPRAME